MINFFSQSYPFIWSKFKYIEKGPFTSQAEVLAKPFKLYNERDEKAPKQKYLMMVKAFQQAIATAKASYSPKI